MVFEDDSLSLLLGYMSIFCWLGAQLPQLVVNWRRKSVDGLALPFLANWLLGDTANLIGCIFTNQLPFQTYLATYFVAVDAALIAQYIYYDAPRDAKALTVMASQSARQSRTSLLPPRLAQSPESFTPYRSLNRARSLSYSADSILRAAMNTMALAASEEGTTEIRSRPRPRAISLEGLPESIVAETRIHDWGGRSPQPEDDEPIPSTMSDSFHSEGGGPGPTKHVSWRRGSHERRVRARSPETLGSATPTIRGRQPTRSTPAASSAAEPDYPPRERRESVASAVSAGASRRSASIIFLGVFALFSFSSLYDSKPGSSGIVLNMPSRHSTLDLTDSKLTRTFDRELYSTSLPGSDPLSPLFIPSNVIDRRSSYIMLDEHTEQVIGRVSAWTCTTLYLTSRLPQIWKNYARKSVEGLSMYLFTFAFLGNFFYVVSILTSSKMDLPAPLARQFIRESIPYLLGSGGTLMFDVTIILQSFIYSPSRRSLRSRARRKSSIASRSQEERGLLAEEGES